LVEDQDLDSEKLNKIERDVPTRKSTNLLNQNLEGKVDKYTFFVIDSHALHAHTSWSE
jgi:hypothetical protein